MFQYTHFFNFQELDSVVRSKVKAYLARHQGAELRVMNARIQELMKSEEEWRNKAKDFERKLTELTLKQHKLEKRKAHTAALRVGIKISMDMKHNLSSHYKKITEDETELALYILKIKGIQPVNKFCISVIKKAAK